jgi:hypothetical protein
MESKKINHTHPGSTPSDLGLEKRCGLIFPTLLACWVFLCSAGCPSQSPNKDQPKDTTQKVGRVDLPPLRIGLFDGDELGEGIQSRWQEFSDQPIELIHLERGKISNTEIPSLDVILYPGNFLGTIAETQWIAPLPTPLLQRLGGSSKVGKSNQDQSENPEQGIENWSSRWRSIARYNGKWMALPLGAPCWVAATRGLDVEPLSQLQKAISSNQNNSAISTKAFEEFLSAAEQRLLPSLDERKASLDKLLKDRQSIDKRALVNRFLWIVNTSESRYRGLIDPYKVTPRLALPEFTRSARFLQRLALIEPTTIFCSPVEAWEKVAEARAVFGIGWPRTDGFQRATTSSDAQPLKLIPMLFNGGDGLLVSIGRKTRQSSMAAEFMFWLNREESRAAMQNKTPHIEVLEIDNDANRIREDYREYQTLQRLESSNTTLDMTPRFLQSDIFVESLADALLDILENPETAESRLEACKTKWTGLIDVTGVESLRNSLERATGLSN